MTSGTIGDNCTYHDDCRLAVDNSTCDDVTKTCVCEEAYLSNENGTFCVVREYRPNQRRIQYLHSCSLEQCFLIFFCVSFTFGNAGRMLCWHTPISGGSKRASGTRTPSSVQIFSFHAVSGNILQNNKFAHHPWELAPLPLEILNPPLPVPYSLLIPRILYPTMIVNRIVSQRSG